jgi:NTP pyrophosphatase (non-canonical NTP hydrolase)
VFNDLAREIHAFCRSQGFYDREWIGAALKDGTLVAQSSGFHNPSLASEKLLLIVSEVAEIQDAMRDGDVDHEAEELADVFIRSLDYGKWRGFDIDAAIAAKMIKNRERARLHGRAVF